MSATFELPTTDAEWQDAVDCAEGAIAFDAAKQYGLVRGGPEIRVQRAQELLKLGADRGFHPRADAPEAFVMSLLEMQRLSGRCQICGCTDDNCMQCIGRTGEPCHWVNEEQTLCSACAGASLELARKANVL